MLRLLHIVPFLLLILAQNVEAQFTPPEMIFVEGGTYQMGCLAGRDDKTAIPCQPDEGPAHEVYLGDFEISKFEITNTMYSVVMDDVPSFNLGCGPLCPVNRTNFYDVIIFCNELTKRDTGIDPEEQVYYVDPDFTIPWNQDDHYEITNALLYSEDVYVDVSKKGYRIPTEAEWEYAARGGQSSQGLVYSGSDVLDDVGWFISNSGGFSQEVGLKQANELGIHDMSGNVNEWCWDAYAEFDGDPQCGALSESIDQWKDFHQSQFCCPIVRGGSFSMTNIQSRAAFRNNNLISTSENFDVGIRIVRTVNHRPIEFDLSLQDPTCHMADDGEIVIANVSGGVPTYTYEWTDDPMAGASRDSLAPGEYTMRISDSGVCSYEETFEIFETPKILIELSQQMDPTCFEGDDGEITATVTSQEHITESLDFVWSADQNNSAGIESTASNLFADSSYWVVATLGACNSDTLTFMLDNPPPITFDVNDIDIKVASCTGGCDSEVEILSVNAQSNLDYTFTWFDNDMSTFRDDLCAGTYEITITDDQNCNQPATIVIPESTLQALVIDDIIIDPANCNELGAADVMISSPQGTVLYTLVDSIDDQIENRFEDLNVGMHLIKIVDENNCSDSLEIEVMMSTPPTITSADPIQNESCDQENGIIEVTIQDGVAPLQYSINNGAPQNSNSFENLDSGIYSIQVIDADGCIDSMNSEILMLPSPVITQVDTISERCEAMDGQLMISTVGGIQPITFSIDGGQSFEADSTFRNLDGGDYLVVVKDVAGCLDSLNVFVNEYSSPILDSISTVTYDCELEKGDFAVSHVGGNGDFIYTLDDGLIQADSIFQGFLEGTYKIMVSDKEGCEDVEFFEFIDENCPTVFIPSAFNPDENSINNSFEVFQSINHNATISTYEIYDRWGNIIFSNYDFEISDGQDKWWKGRSDNKSSEVGVYSYLIEVQPEIGPAKVYFGSITLIR